jgi:hypothetical protein
MTSAPIRFHPVGTIVVARVSRIGPVLVLAGWRKPRIRAEGVTAAVDCMTDDREALLRQSEAAIKGGELADLQELAGRVLSADSMTVPTTYRTRQTGAPAGRVGPNRSW